jgi:hypothetical protein
MQKLDMTLQWPDWTRAVNPGQATSIQKRSGSGTACVPPAFAATFAVGMPLLALVPADSKACLEKAAPSPSEIVHAVSLGQFRQAIEKQPFSALIIDPALLSGVEDLMEFARLLGAREVPVLLLGTERASGWQGLGKVVSALTTVVVLVDLFILDTDHDPTIVRLRLRALSSRISSGLIKHSIPRIAEVDATLASEVARALSCFPLPRNGAAFARKVGRVRRTLDRKLQAVGFGGGVVALCSVSCSSGA